MQNTKISQHCLTRIFLETGGLVDDDANCQIYQAKWWWAIRNSEASFRLTESGFDFLINNVRLKPYEIVFKNADHINAQTLIFLDRFLDCPWYLKPFSITVFGERKAFELKLFADDIEHFGLIKALKRSN